MKFPASVFPKPFATLEPSVSAYHLAFGLDGKLYLTAPGLSSFDAVYVIDGSGIRSKLLSRIGQTARAWPLTKQEICMSRLACADDAESSKFHPTKQAEIFVAGMNVVGLCFNRKGEMIVADK